MKQTESYIVKPVGSIKGGDATYTADFETGDIAYSGKVLAKVLFFSKTVPFSGIYKVGVDELKSKTLSTVGNVLKIETVAFKVVSITDNIAAVDVSIDGKEASGRAYFDISADFLKLVGLSANVSYSGLTFTINLQRV